MIKLAIPSLELQKALFSTLSSGDYPVYEMLPSSIPKNYIILGEEMLQTDNTKTQRRTVHVYTIHTWSQGTSSYNSKIINNFVLDKLLLEEFTVPNFHVDMVNLELLTTLKEFDQEENDTLQHGIIQVEFTLNRMEEL